MFLFLKRLLIVSKSLKLIIVWLIINIVRTDIALSALSVRGRGGMSRVRVAASTSLCQQHHGSCYKLLLLIHSSLFWKVLQPQPGSSSLKRWVRWSSDATIVLFHTCKDIQAAQSMGGSVNKLAKVFHCLNSGVGDRPCADCNGAQMGLQDTVD